MFGLHREAFVRPPEGTGVERRASFSFSFSSMITGGYPLGIRGKMAHKKARMFQKYGNHLIFETYSPCVQGNSFCLQEGLQMH